MPFSPISQGKIWLHSKPPWQCDCHHHGVKAPVCGPKGKRKGVKDIPRTARIRSRSGYYHIVNRGIGRQILFEDEKDYLRFLETLKKVAGEESFEIIAYCLMENHIHMLLHVEKELGRIMKRITGSYARYYNEKYERTGHLFQDRYRSEPIENERSLCAVVRYIHNNPVKAGVCSREDYLWSSWHEYVETADFVSSEMVLGLTGGKTGFLDFSAVEDNVKYGCLDIPVKKKPDDVTAQKIICEELHLDSGTKLQTMDRKKRNFFLRVLKKKGLSVRQIERLTGINRGVVAKA